MPPNQLAFLAQVLLDWHSVFQSVTLRTDLCERLLEHKQLRVLRKHLLVPTGAMPLPHFSNLSHLLGN